MSFLQNKTPTGVLFFGANIWLTFGEIGNINIRRRGFSIFIECVLYFYLFSIGF